VEKQETEQGPIGPTSPLEAIQSLFQELRGESTDPFFLEAYSQFSELCIDVMNGNDSRHLMLGSAGAVVNKENFGTVFSILHVVNQMYDESTKISD
jgi:hypothetical protein